VSQPLLPSQRKMSTGRLIRLVGTVIAVALMVWLLWQQNWQEIWQNVAQIGTARFLLAICMLLASRVAISFRWYALLRGAGEDVTYFSSLRLTFAGLFGNNFLPSTIGGDGIRLAGAIQAGWSGTVVAASLVMDRLVGMTGMAAFLPFTLPRVLAQYSLGSAGVLAMAAGSSGEAEDENLFQRLWERGKRVVRRIWETIVLWVKRPGTLVLPLLFTFIHALLTFGMLYLILQGLGETLSFWEVGGMWGLVYFITLLPISIGGIGLQEWAIWFTFHQLGGVSEAHSLTMALLFRTLMMLSSLPGAAFVPGILEKRGDSR
jgi:uncharacterized membrane protein YbhN (UPF0104 family)